MPSTVMTSASATCASGTRQLFTTSPFTSTAHAPHSPSPHPSLAPVSWRSSRSTSSSRASGCASIASFFPLTLQLTLMAALDKRTFHGLHQYLRCYRNPIEAEAGRVLYRIDDRRRGTIYWQLADALRSCRPMSIRRLFEMDADAGQISRGRHDVIRHLAIDHAPFSPHYILIEREANTLRDASLDLPSGKHRIYHAAHLLHGNEI